MKKIILKKILPGLLIIVGLILIIRCEEEIISPQKNGSSVNLHIKGNKLNICKGDTVVTDAANAQFAFVSKQGQTLDTLFTGNLNDKGEWDTLYNIELLGIPNVRVHGLLDLRKATDSIVYVCCDTSFVLNFIYDCNEIVEFPVRCDNLDTTMNLSLTNKFGGDILLGTPETDIAGNRFQLNSTENITVNINEANALNGDFRAEVSSVADNNGNVELGTGKQPLVIDFFVKTDVKGEFKKTINLKTTCATGETGNIEINLTSVITDDNCSCPFSSDNKVEKEMHPPVAKGIQLGTTSQVSVDPIIDANDFMLDEGCFMVIKSVERFNSPVAATTLEESGIKHEWKIDPQNFPVELRNGISTFSLSATFTPYQVGERTDTFKINIVVNNAAGESKDTCSYLVSYTGDCCNSNICPSIMKTNDLPADLINGVNGTVMHAMTPFEKIEMGSGNTIKQTMTGLMGTLCTSFIGDANPATYTVSLPALDSIMACSDVDITIEKEIDGTTDDRQYFNLTNSSFSIDEGGLGIFSVQFKTPDVRSFIEGGHSSIYKAKLKVRASDMSGEICSQVIDLVANVESKQYKISKSTNMKSFYQTSDNDSVPSYAVYKISTYNPLYQYYGQQDKLDPDQGTVKLFTNPPSPDTDHSFYFEVDQPENLTLRQKPKLYLVDSEDNRYSMISAQPIARYNNNNAFTSDLDNLMEDAFTANFQSRGNAPITSFQFTSSGQIMWTPSLSANQLSGSGNGLDIKMGDVYVIWNPTGNSESIIDKLGISHNNYCDVAFLYIEGISDGSESTHHIGNVTYYVVYPLTTIVQ